MNKQIEQVIREYWDKELPKAHERDITLALEKNFINDIVGPRRAGKTYLMFLTIQHLLQHTDKQATIYINFENRKLMPLQEHYFNDIITFIHAEELLKKNDMLYIFLDEIQRIPGWEQYIRSIYDEFKGTIQLFVSGSSATLLSKEYAQLLTGRHLTTTVMPLSFHEFLQFQHIDIDNSILTEQKTAQVEKQLLTYLTTGGFPDVVFATDKEAIVSQLFSDIVTRDVLTRTGIRKEDVVEEFAYYLASNVAHLLSFNKMKNYFVSKGIKISVPTLTNYFWHLKNAFLFFDSLIFSHTIKDQLQYPRKIYCVDNGIANITGFKTTENIGKVYENTVAIELIRRGFDIYYWKSKQHEEVDFVAKKGIHIAHLIQVCSDLESPDTKQREVKALLKALTIFKLKEGLIITKDVEATEQINGKQITYIPLWNWLLHP